LQLHYYLVTRQTALRSANSTPPQTRRSQEPEEQLEQQTVAAARSKPQMPDCNSGIGAAASVKATLVTN